MKFAQAVVMLVLVIGVGCSQEEIVPTVKQAVSTHVGVQVAAVERSRLHATLEFSGTLLPIRATMIVPDVEGIIESFPLSDRAVRYMEDGQMAERFLGLGLGHEVRKGDVLVKLHDSDFRLEWEAAKANLELAKKELENLLAWQRPEEVTQLKAQLAQATAAWDLARADLDRSDELFEQEVVTAGEHDIAIMAEKTAQAAMQAAQAGLDLAKAGPTQEQIAVGKAKITTAEIAVALRQDSLDKTTILAPYDGVVSDRFVDVGDRVQPMPRTDILQIIDSSALFAQINVPEQYQGRITLYDIDNPGRETDRVWVEADCLDEPVLGRVDLINSKIDPETRSFRVRVTIDNRSRLLRPGGFVRVVVPVATVTDVLSVPTGAVTVSEGVHAVFVYEEQTGRVASREVTIGLTDQSRYEIRKGLALGERVVVGNTAVLADGIPVRLETPEGGNVTELQTAGAQPSSPRHASMAREAAL